MIKITNNFKKILDELSYAWYSWYSTIIPAIFVVATIAWQNKCEVEFWKAQYYPEMLTALITFLSIVISVFGILIPSMISVKDEKNSLTKYFFDNADTNFFAKAIKRTILSGIASVLVVCLLYLYDVMNVKLFKCVFATAVFVAVYFCCNAYRFIGIMLKLLIGTNDKNRNNTGKRYKNQMSEEERMRINEQLKKNN